MADILSLSPEILLSIVRTLDKPDILHLTLACKQLRAIADVELYRSITWTWYHQDQAKSPPLHRLLENILNRPDVAKRVHHFSVTEVGYGFVPLLGNVLSPSYLRKCDSIIESINVANTTEWAEKLTHGCLETIIALLLSQLRNLESVNISLFFREDDDLACHKTHTSPVSQVFRSAVTTEPGTQGSASVARFAKLTSLAWPCPKYGGPVAFLRTRPLSDVVPVFLLPRLTCATLKIDQPTTQDQRINPWLALPVPSPTLAPPVSQLTTLRLRHSTVTDDVLYNLLAATPSLQVLDIQSAQGLSTVDDPVCPGFDGAKLKAALLRSCSTSLKSLRLVCEIFDDHSFVDADLDDFFRRPVGSLREFPALESLHIALAPLLGSGVQEPQRLCDALPRSLSKLIVRDDGYTADCEIIKELMIGFAPLAKTAVFTLQEVGLAVEQKTWDAEDLHDLWEMYANADLHFVIQDPSGTDLFL